MKIDIAESIREVLYERQAVSIYGLGTLCLKQIPSQYGEGRKSLLAPQMTLDFKESSSTNSALIQWISDKYDISREEAEKSLKLFSERILNNLLNYRKVNIKGVALIERGEDNGILIKADQSLTESFYKNFPEVSLELPKNNGQTNVVPPLTIKDNDKKEEIVGFEGKLPDEELEGDEDLKKGDSASGKNIKQEAEKDSDSNKRSWEEQAFKSSDEASSTVFDLPNGDEDTAISEILPEWSEHEKESEEKSGKRKWGILLAAIAIMITIFLCYDACKVYMSRQSLDKSKIGTLDKNALEEGEAADSVALAMLKGSELESAASSDSCIIVTGVFTRPENILAMQRRIESMSYSSFTQENGIYTRVGLIFPCDSKNLENFIREVRQQISPKAWYLQPELYVAYASE